MDKKIRKNFTIDKKVSEEFVIYCNENSINMSKLIENLLKKYLEDRKIRK